MSNKLKNKYDLVVDARMLDASGIGEYIISVLTIISEKCNYKIALLVFEKDFGCFESKGMNNLSYIILRHKVYSLLENIELSFKIPKCKIYWSPHFNTSVFPTRSKKRLTTIHDVFHLANPSSFGFLELVYIKLRYQMAGLLSNKIITVSKFSKREIKNYLGEKAYKKTSVIYNGFKNLSKQTTLSDEGTENKILFVGNLKPHKNLKILLDAIDNINLTRELKLVIVGKTQGFINPLSTSILNRIENNKNVVLTGYISNEELSYNYKTASIFVFPSYYEGFGLPILEAYSKRTPTIVSKIPPFEEVASDASIYFDPYDYKDLAQKITNTLDSKEKRKVLIKKGEERLMFFSWSKSAIKHVDLINSMLTC